MPCSVCNDFSRQYISEIANVTDLRGSVDRGCPFCDVVYQALDNMFFLDEIADFRVTTMLRATQSSVQTRLKPGYQVKQGDRGPSSHVLIEDVIIYCPEGLHNFIILIMHTTPVSQQLDKRMA